MVLRDTYITYMSRISAFLFLLLLGACQQNPTPPPPASTAQSNKNENGAIAISARQLNKELQTAMEEMDGIFQTAQELNKDNSGGDKTENTNVVFKKSGTVLGAMFILKGSIAAVEQRFNEGILDEKQAQEMLNKLRVDLKSYQNDIKGYREILDGAAPAKPEKK